MQSWFNVSALICASVAVFCCRGEPVGGPLLQPSTQATSFPSNGGTSNIGLPNSTSTNGGVSTSVPLTQVGGCAGSGGISDSSSSDPSATGGSANGTGGVASSVASTLAGGASGSGGMSNSSSGGIRGTGAAENGTGGAGSSQLSFSQGGAAISGSAANSGGDTALATGGYSGNNCGTRLDLCAAGWMLVVNASLLDSNSTDDAGSAQ